MTFTRTGADLARRLDEEIAEFSARSLVKSDGRSRADIVWRPPYPGMKSLLWPEETGRTVWVIRPAPQSWGIVYRRPDRNDEVIEWGVTIGWSRAQAVAWLIRQRRQWGTNNKEQSA